MDNKIGIINYGVAGNIASVKKTVDKAGGISVIVNKPEDFQLIDKLVIPGVGSFKDAMNELKNDNLVESLLNFNRPILGICLGMQLITKLGYEFGKTEGLGLIEGHVDLIKTKQILPHIGFNKIDVIASNPLLNGLEDELFYFMHSYQILGCQGITSTTKYGNDSFISSVNQGDIFGVQFHPEKSREQGIELFRNFFKY